MPYWLDVTINIAGTICGLLIIREFAIAINEREQDVSKMNETLMNIFKENIKNKKDQNG